MRYSFFSLLHAAADTVTRPASTSSFDNSNAPNVKPC